MISDDFTRRFHSTARTVVAASLVLGLGGLGLLGLVVWAGGRYFKVW